MKEMEESRRAWFKRIRRGLSVAALSGALLVLLATQAMGEGISEKDTKAKSDSRFGKFSRTFRERIGVAERVKGETADEVLLAVDSLLVTKALLGWKRYLNSVAQTPEWLDLGVAFRVRYEMLTNPFRKGEFGTDKQLPLRTRARVGLNSRIFRVLFEFQDSRAIGTDPGEFESTAQTNKHSIQQLFGSATFRNVFGTGLRTDVHVGRLNLNFGRRRLIARNLFRNTTNAFDGAHWNLGRDDLWRVRAFIVRPVERTFEGLDRSDDDELFWGTYYETRQIPWLSTNLYYYGLNDRKPDIQDQRQYSTLGFRLYALPKVAWFDYEAQTAWQVGTKAGNDHFAYFLHGQVGYTFDAAWLPRLLFQYDYASGTRSPTGSQSGTFDTLFGARRWEYTPTGIFGPFFRSNISSPGVRLSVTPVPRTRLSLKVRAWWLAQSRDAWVGSGLQDPTGRSGNVLGQDLELRATWKPMSFVIFDTGYDHFFKGSYIESLARVPGNPPATDSDYFYIQTEIRF